MEYNHIFVLHLFKSTRDVTKRETLRRVPSGKSMHAEKSHDE